MKLFPSRHRGFVLLLALAVFAIVSVAIMTLAASGTKAGLLTSMLMMDAQVEQLLLAGTEQAPSHLEGAQMGQSWDLAVPLEHATFKSTVAQVKENEVTVQMVAAWDGRTMHQQVTYRRDGGRWQLVNTTLTD